MPYNLEYYDDKIQKKLSEENHDFLASYIFSKWDEWNSLRSRNLESISAVEKAIYPDYKSFGGVSSSSGSKINIRMPEIYEIRETYKAHLWKSWFSSLDSMFDVQGKAKQCHDNAAKQKASLIDIFRSINLVSKFEKGLDNWINKGEFIAFISWSTQIKKIRRKSILSEKNLLNGDEVIFDNEYSKIDEIFIGEGNDKSENKKTSDGVNEVAQKHFSAQNGNDFEVYSASPFTIKDETLYDGPDITIVPSEAFVFDPSKKENFETCPKIYRSWATFDEIKANKLYKNLDGIEEICSHKDSQFSDNKATRNDQIEILEFWGNVKLKDGTLLRNYVITLAGRKNIIRFEENPFIINPFIFAAFLEDPETKRGYSPLFVALPLNEISETIMNLQLDALRLVINKPYLAPKGALSGKINIKEGAIIEYDPTLMPNQPIPLDFKDAIVGWDFLRFFESKIESTTGIFKYMTGDPRSMNQRTATEATGIITGQNIRLSKEIDVLNYKVKMPIIEKIAELIANFSFDIKEIKVSLSNGDIDFVSIDESVRQGNYDYLIGDSNAAFERKTKLKDSMDLLFQMAKEPEIAPRIKWVEVMKWAFGQIGSVDPNMFIKD